jgi:hypothetical protein
MGIYYRQNCVRSLVTEHNKILKQLRNYMVATGLLLSRGLRDRQLQLDQQIRVALGLTINRG